MKTYSYFPRPNTIIIETSHAWSDQYEHLDLPRGNLHADYYKTCGQSAYGWGDPSPYYLAIGSAARGFTRQMEKKGLTVNGRINEELFAGRS